MKVRWTSGSIRFRITPQELSALEHREKVTEVIVFPGGRTWKASITPSGGETRVQLVDNIATMFLSDLDIAHLASPEVEGVYFGGLNADDLRYLVEKDFPCVHPRASHALDPATETFTPPSDFAERKAVPLTS